MNKSLVRLAVPCTLLACCVAAPARAQFGGPPGGYAPSPVYSPYLNLLRGGNPAINYYGLVRPQFAFQAAAFNLQNQIGLLGEEVASASILPTFPTTGHPAAFQFTGHYYPLASAAPAQGSTGAVTAASGAARLAEAAWAAWAAVDWAAVAAAGLAAGAAAGAAMAAVGLAAGAAGYGGGYGGGGYGGGGYGGGGYGGGGYGGYGGGYGGYGGGLGYPR